MRWTSGFVLLSPMGREGRRGVTRTWDANGYDAQSYFLCHVLTQIKKSPMIHRLRGWTVLVLVFALALMGCGSSGGTRGVGEGTVDTGYGTAPGKTATPGSSVSGENASEQDPGAQDLHELLRGRVSGVDVFRTAGGGVRIQIHGPQSIFGRTDPLYVVDGVTVKPAGNGRFPWVQPSNIKSITVLKGSEASIYGVRGANGVIVIRTKNR